MEHQRRRPRVSTCQICGSVAQYKHFGVISCFPCKMFFKRNALLEKNLICDFHGQCDINIYNRHVCSACRLAKCFSTGMKVELIRLSSTHNQSINKNRTKPSKQIIKFNHIQKMSTIHFLEKDDLLLNQNESILLSNIKNIFDESKMILTIQNAQSAAYLLHDQLLRKFKKTIYEAVEIFFGRNNDIRNLSSNDQSILLYSVAEKAPFLIGFFVCYFSQLYQNKIIMQFYKDLYGQGTADYECGLSKFIPWDSVLLKLALSLFAFSSNIRVFHRNMNLEFDNISKILAIQNKYVEVTWKYLICRYGYRIAIRRFMTLVEWFLSMTVLVSYASEILIHVNDVQSLIEQMEIALIVDDVT